MSGRGSLWFSSFWSRKWEVLLLIDRYQLLVSGPAFHFFSFCCLDHRTARRVAVKVSHDDPVFFYSGLNEAGSDGFVMRRGREKSRC